MRLLSLFVISFIPLASLPVTAGAVSAGSQRVAIGADAKIVMAGYRCGLTRHWAPAVKTKYGWRKGHCAPDSNSASSVPCPEHAPFSRVQCAEFAVSTEH
jgi:hypothetical protein